MAQFKINISLEGGTYNWSVVKVSSPNEDLDGGSSNDPTTAKKDACTAITFYKNQYPDSTLENQTGDDIFDHLFEGKVKSCEESTAGIASTAISEAEAEVEQFEAAQGLIQIPEFEEPEVVSGATHYIYLPPGDDIFAILRSGFISSKVNLSDISDSDAGSLDIVKGETYTIDQTHFTNSIYKNKDNTAGYPLEKLPRNTLIQVLKEGFGANAEFSRVSVWDEETGAWKYREENNSAFIDSRVLTYFDSYYSKLSIKDGELGLDVSLSTNRKSRLPKVQTDDPNPNFTAPTWTAQEMCDPFLDERTREYCVTIELPSGESPAWEAVSAARRKGINFLLEYYDKNFSTDVVNRLMYLGGDNYSKLSDTPTEGLFSVCKEVSASDRDDNMIKYLIAIPQTYFDAPWLEIDRSKLITRQDYIDAGLVKHQYIIKNSELSNRVNSLSTNLKTEFKTRIDSHEGEATISSEDIDKKIKRLETFHSSMKSFLKANDEDLNEPNGNIEFGLDDLFQVQYIAYNKDKSDAKYLRKKISCINSKNKVFADSMTSAYLFYAKDIEKAIKENKYSGIELVQKFTFPIPEVSPSKKARDTRFTTAIMDQKQLMAKSTKTKDEMKRKNTLLGDRKQRTEKEIQAGIEQFFSGDDIFINFDNLLDSIGDIKELFDVVLDKIPLFNLLAKAALCLLHKLGIDDLLNMLIQAFFSILDPKHLINLLTNPYLMSLMEERCPDAPIKIEIIITEAFEFVMSALGGALKIEEKKSLSKLMAEIGAAKGDVREVNFDILDIDFDLSGLWQAMLDIFDFIVERLKEEGLITCFLESLCEALKVLAGDGIDAAEAEIEEHKTDSLLPSDPATSAVADDLGISFTIEDAASATVAAVPGMQGFQNLMNVIPGIKSINCELLIMILENQVLGTRSADEISKKKMEQIGIRLPELEYSDDPMAFLDKTILKEIMKVLNEVLTPIIKVILEELGLLCQGLSIGTPLENEAATAPNSDELSPDDFDTESPNFFDEASDILNSPGTQNILDNFSDAAQEDMNNILQDLVNNFAGMPITPETINNLKNLIDILSNILRPTEICTLLSGGATEVTLRIILKLIQDRPEFDLIAAYLDSTDAIAKLFKLLGEYANQNYCKTAVKDISLISLLCETELNEQMYCKVLKKKGFSSEECQEIIDKNKDRDVGKLAVLQEMLAADSLSDYFQDKMPAIHCTPGHPGILPVNDNYMEGIIDIILNSLLSLVKMQFEAETLGIKSTLIEEKIIPYGGTFPRPPELGRDYMNTEIPVGSIGTPMEGKLFAKTVYLSTTRDEALDLHATKVAIADENGWDHPLPNALADMAINGPLRDGDLDDMCPAGKPFKDYEIGEQIIANWPMVDRVDRLVAPRFLEESKNIRDVGQIGILTNDESEIDFTKKFTVSIDEINQPAQALILAQRQRINELAKLAEFTSGSFNPTNNIFAAAESLANLTIRKNLVEYKLPSYKFLNSDDAFTKNIPKDYSSFSVTKIPVKKEDKKAKTTIFNLTENSADQETFIKINQIADNPTDYGSSWAPNTNKGTTLQEYTFAKMLSWSLSDIVPNNSDNGKKIMRDIEKQFATLFSFAMANKQNEIIEECLKSRFFDAFNLDKLIATPMTPAEVEALKCSDYPNVDLSSLKKGLLDFEDIKEEAKNFYNDIACETHSRGPEGKDPIDDALQYAMVLISIRLAIAETVFRSLFFFSRFSAKETIVDSGIFMSLVVAKIKDQADSSKDNPRFFAEIKKIAKQKLRSRIEGHGALDFLSNKIMVDIKPDTDAIKNTNFKEKIFNLADISTLTEAIKTKKLSLYAIKLIENNNSIFDPEESNNIASAIFAYITNTGDPLTNVKAAASPLLTRLNLKFEDLALKYVINKTAGTMASKIDSIFLDKDRINAHTKKTLLSSNIIFDVPSELVTADEGDTRQGDMSILSDENTIDLQAELMENPNFLNTYISPAPPETDTPPKYGPSPPSHPNNLINLVDYKTEKDLILGTLMPGWGEDPDWHIPFSSRTTNFKNISLDATPAGSILSNGMRSTFYNYDGSLTKLGKATKNGGFIVQKYVSAELKNSSDFADGSAPKAFIDKFIEYALGDNSYSTEDPYTKIELSYKQFDFALEKALLTWKDLTGEDNMYALTGNDVPNPVWPYIEFKLLSVFRSLSYGIKLVYIMPHNVDSIDHSSQDSDPYTVPLADPKRRPARGSIPTNHFGPYNTTGENRLGQIEDLLLESVKKGMPYTLSNNKLYQIKEAIPKDLGNILEARIINFNNDPEFSGYNPDIPPLIELNIRNKVIKPFFIIPIGPSSDRAAVNKTLDALMDMSNGKVYNKFFAQTATDGAWAGALPTEEDISRIVPVIEQLGHDAYALIPELFEKPNVKIFNNYILSSTNLLNFAVLQQSYFPYNKKFDFDDLFSASRKMINDIFNDSEEDKENWIPLLNDEILTGWRDEIALTMTGQTPEGAFFQWLIEVIPKWLLRWYIAGTDPCMKDAFDQQDENEWDDKKLPEIVFGSLFTKPKNCSKEFDELIDNIPGLKLALDLLGISVPDYSEERKCLPGIRPVPIFPTTFPFYGDALKPITPAGLIYTALGFLIDNKEKYMSDVPIPTTDLDVPEVDICGPDSNLNQNPGLITQEDNSTSPSED